MITITEMIIAIKVPKAIIKDKLSYTVMRSPPLQGKKPQPGYKPIVINSKDAVNISK